MVNDARLTNPKKLWAELTIKMAPLDHEKIAIAWAEHVESVESQSNELKTIGGNQC